MDSVVESVVAALRKSLKDGHGDVSPSDPLESFGLDSLAYILVLLELQEANPSYRIDLDRISSAKTVRDLASIIHVLAGEDRP